MSSVVQPILSFEATVLSRGRVTLPSQVRRQLGLQQGSSVRFSLHASNPVEIAIVPLLELEDLWRLADSKRKPKRAMSFAAMNKAKVRHES